MSDRDTHLRKEANLILSDTQIRARLQLGDLLFDPPLEDRQIQSASIDLRLGSEFGQYFDTNLIVDARESDHERMHTFDTGGDPFILRPGAFVLGRTLEMVAMPHAAVHHVEYVGGIPGCISPELRPREVHTTFPPLVGMVQGRSSTARKGVTIEQAGFIDPGFVGTITLELFNAGPRPVRLYPGDRICQLVLFETGHVARPYGSPELGSKYNGQTRTTASRGL